MSSSASESVWTKIDVAGVKVNPCFTLLSMHMKRWPLRVNAACITDPSVPGPPGPWRWMLVMLASLKSDT